MKISFLSLLLIYLTSLSGMVIASEEGEALRKRLAAVRPDLPVESVSTTPMEGIYALELAGGTMLYGTADGNYLFAGDMYELTDTSLVNLAETRRSQKRRILVQELDEKDMVVFPARGETKAVINVFTDVDCGYCRKLHQEIAEINGHGIEVRYLAYPRAGIGSESYDKIVSAWCSADRQQAITDLKAGKSLPSRTCENPVADQYALGQKIGINGTPAILLSDGRLLPGYMPARALASALGLE